MGALRIFKGRQVTRDCPSRSLNRVGYAYLDAKIQITPGVECSPTFVCRCLRVVCHSALSMFGWRTVWRSPGPPRGLAPENSMHPLILFVKWCKL